MDVPREISQLKRPVLSFNIHFREARHHDDEVRNPLPAARTIYGELTVRVGRCDLTKGHRWVGIIIRDGLTRPDGGFVPIPTIDVNTTLRILQPQIGNLGGGQVHFGLLGDCRRRSYVRRMSPQVVTARSSLTFVLMDRLFRELCAPMARERPINANIARRSRASLDLMLVTDTNYSRMVGLLPDHYP